MGFDYADPHAQHDLPAIPESRRARDVKPRPVAMIEAAAALLVFLSVSVFLAHAFDAYRTWV